MLNINEAFDRLEAIETFFIRVFEILKSYDSHECLLEVCEPILDLVYRIYSDEQYPSTEKVKSLSYEIVDYLSNTLEKGVFLKIFNNVK